MDVFMAIVSFYVFWGLMAFYNTNHRIEKVYYITAILFVIIVLVIKRIISQKLTICEEKEQLSHKIHSVSVCLLIYITVILVLEKTNFSTVLQDTPAPENNTALIICLAVFVITIPLIVIKTFWKK